MNPISCFLVLVVVVVAVSAGEDHFGNMKGRFAVWTKCHKGYTGLTPSQLVAGQKCQDMNIKDIDCYLSCFRYETGMINTSDKRWNHEAAIQSMAPMWDAQHQVEGGKWYEDTHKCIADYENKGGTWAMDYHGNCSNPDFEVAKACIRDSRKCK